MSNNENNGNAAGGSILEELRYTYSQGTRGLQQGDELLRSAIAEIERLRTENANLLRLVGKNCSTCKYSHEAFKLSDDEPCISCVNHSKWEATTE